MSIVSLGPITTNNEATCLALNVNVDQRTFVASNERSLSQARDNRAMIPLGIMLEATMVGFALWEPRTRVIASIHRLMIDSRYQRLGYGKRSMIALLEEIIRSGHTTTYLSFKLDNIAARFLYESLGFVFQEAEADGEILYRLGPPRVALVHAGDGNFCAKTIRPGHDH